MCCILNKLIFSNMCMSKLGLENASTQQLFRLTRRLPYISLKQNYSVCLEKEDNYAKCCMMLQVSKNCDQEEVRKAFLKMVKRFHPDSGSAEANAEKFNQIETAYRTLQSKFARERWNVNEGEGEYGLYYKEKKQAVNFDIEHTAPQHRQYLSYGGYGSGTPQQRQHQYQKFRAMAAVESVYQHRAAKLTNPDDGALLAKDRKESQKVKTRSEMDRLVEDLIQESMARGDFDNLSGSGKPLKYQTSNPYVDFVTHKMNEVLIDNGFTPEWITLEKEIHKETQDLRDSLKAARAWLGPLPLSEKESAQWTATILEHHQQGKMLNSKINKFNLVVPLLWKQMLLVSLEKEAERVLREGCTKLDTRHVQKEDKPEREQAPQQDFLCFMAFLLTR